MPEDRVTLLERVARWIARFFGRRLDRPRTAWWDPDLPLRTASIHGHAICYATAGDGPPVVLVHGFGTSMAIYARQIRALSGRFRVFALDLLGHGFSEKPDIDYTPEVYLDLLSGFLDAQGIDAAHFVGHSMGGLLSICLATVAPGRVRRLVLLNSSSPLFRPERQMRLYEKSLRRPWLWKRIWETFEVVIPLLPASFERKTQDRMACDTEAIPPAWIRHQVAVRRSKGFARMVASTMAGWARIAEYEDAVRKIPHPALLVSGDGDRIVPLEHGRLLARTLPDATLEVLPGCGHMSTLERPEQTAGMILDFLTGDTPCGDGSVGPKAQDRGGERWTFRR